MNKKQTLALVTTVAMLCIVVVLIARVPNTVNGIDDEQIRTIYLGQEIHRENPEFDTEIFLFHGIHETKLIIGHLQQVYKGGGMSNLYVNYIIQPDFHLGSKHYRVLDSGWDWIQLEEVKQEHG